MLLCRDDFPNFTQRRKGAKHWIFLCAFAPLREHSLVAALRRRVLRGGFLENAHDSTGIHVSASAAHRPSQRAKRLLERDKDQQERAAGSKSNADKSPAGQPRRGLSRKCASVLTFWVPPFP